MTEKAKPTLAEIAARVVIAACKRCGVSFGAGARDASGALTLTVG
jgi:hypothetical protein